MLVLVTSGTVLSQNGWFVISCTCLSQTTRFVIALHSLITKLAAVLILIVTDCQSIMTKAYPAVQALVKGTSLPLWYITTFLCLSNASYLHDQDNLLSFCSGVVLKVKDTAIAHVGRIEGSLLSGLAPRNRKYSATQWLVPSPRQCGHVQYQ